MRLELVEINLKIFVIKYIVVQNVLQILSLTVQDAEGQEDWRAAIRKAQLREAVFQSGAGSGTLKKASVISVEAMKNKL